MILFISKLFPKNSFGYLILMKLLIYMEIFQKFINQFIYTLLMLINKPHLLKELNN